MFLVSRLLLKNFKFILQFVVAVQYLIKKHMALGKKKPKELLIKQKVMAIKQNESEGNLRGNLLRLRFKQNPNTEYTFYWKET